MTRASRRRAAKAQRPTPGGAPADRSAPASAERATQLLLAAAWLVVLAWIVAVDFRPVTNNDFWYHLRVGEDILASGAVPRVDVYTGLVHGQPLIEAGWLAAVIMALIHRYAGPWAFTALSDLAGVVTALLLYLALPRAQRRSLWAPPLLGLCFYLIAFRIAVRPLVFTMPILAAFAYCLERWRRTRRPGDLAPLILIEVLWANVHGSLLFGPALLWGLVGCCAGLAVLPWLQAVPDEAPYELRHVVQLAVVAAGCSAAILATPYGPDSAAVALNTWGGSDFIRRSLSEWQGPFDTVSYFRDHFQYLFWAYCALLPMLAGALLVRLRQRPLLDAAIVGVTVYLSLQANRFIPYAAIFGYPVMVRSGSALAARFALRMPTAAIAAAEMAFGAVLLGGTIAWGYPYGVGASAPLGWGIAEKMPRAEAEFLRERGWSGLIYNEVMTDGSYLLYALYPRLRPVMDAHLGGNEALYEEYEATRSRPDLLAAYVAKYDVQVALLVPGSWISRRFARDPQWQLVERTPQRLLFARR